MHTMNDDSNKLIVMMCFDDGCCARTYVLDSFICRCMRIYDRTDMDAIASIFIICGRLTKVRRTAF